MAKVVKPKASAGKRKGKYQMPDPIPKGEILTDLTKKQWKLGPSIGKGGFGEIYSATEVSTGKNTFVVKIEPKENGPLFVEMHFFMKVCKTEDIEKWMKSKNLKFLGLPRFVGNGSHVHKEKPYRFIVMEKFGNNLDSVLQNNRGVLAGDYIFKTALQILDALEYIHSRGYVHADIKAGNLLLGSKKGSEDQVYLVDFGLASKYSSEFKPDPKCAHNGTIEFTSRDAHVGATTRRGDLEILGYNILRWFTSRLPWEDKLSDCVYVQQQKLKYMKDLPGLMEKCFGSGSFPASLIKYFNYVAHMAPTVEPDYNLCRNIFREGLKESSQNIISPSKKSLKTKLNSQDAKKSKQNTRAEDEEEDYIPEKKPRSPTKVMHSKKLLSEETKSLNLQKNGSGEIENAVLSEVIDKKKSPATKSTIRKVQSEKNTSKEKNNKQESAENVAAITGQPRDKEKKNTKDVSNKKEQAAVIVDSVSSRPVRAVRALTNGYMDETLSFSDSDDSDIVYSPPKSVSKNIVMKRKSDEVYSPKKKRH